MRLITKDGNRVSNGRIVKKNDNGTFLVCSDCFNLMVFTEAELNELYSKPEYSEFEPEVPFEDFIEQIEYNIKAVKGRLKEGL